jgi:MFS family permease
VVDIAVYRIFAGVASAAIWSVAQAIVLLYIGMHGNRRAQVAGIFVVVSLIAANFAPPGIDGYILAAGMLGGYAGFGVSELLVRDGDVT